MNNNLYQNVITKVLKELEKTKVSTFIASTSQYLDLFEAYAGIVGEALSSAIEQQDAHASFKVLHCM